jgi:hypothetical protein
VLSSYRGEGPEVNTLHTSSPAPLTTTLLLLAHSYARSSTALRYFSSALATRWMFSGLLSRRGWLEQGIAAYSPYGSLGV